MKSTLRTHKFLLSGVIVVTILTFVYLNTSTNDIKCVPAIPGAGKRTILYWTPIWGRDAISLLGGRDVFHCTPHCVITSNRCLQSIADDVVFHFSDISLLDVPKKKENQKWIYYSSESPDNTLLTPTLFLQLMNNQITGVMSYRHDSQVHVPYAKVIERKERGVWKAVPVKPQKVAWFVSNCKTASRREDLVHELSKFIPVDIYGSCGDMSCPRGNDSCNQMLQENYSFYLALENSLCKDYVTEKMFRTLQYNIIPIVLGPRDNYSHLPKGSFIDAGSFRSLPLLAVYLNRVAANETLYNSYLEWKSKFQVQLLGYEDVLCAPCRQNVTNDAKRTKTWSTWWFDDAQCFSWKTRR